MKRCTAFLLCIVAVIYEFGDVHGKDGYPLTTEGLKFSCAAGMLVGDNRFCQSICKSRGSSYGYCYAFGCYCEGLNNDVKVWGE
uniref:Putative Sodium channel toxin n=1 Tax=Megacormus gertschi TaxID=1843536 RepID=A0A224X3Y8_9SCOR